MLKLRRSADRGYFDHGWLKTHHTFSFADYYDPQQLGFGSLRVINEDHIAPGAGFPMHGHRDMEIITYVVGGTLEHKDSLGSVQRIRPGRLQHMTAGSGVLHSEYNPSSSEPVHLLQIWVKPQELRLAPAYHEFEFTDPERTGQLLLIAAPAGKQLALPVEQDLYLFTSLLVPGQAVRHELAPGRRSWVQLVRGEVELRDADDTVVLAAGDGVACTAVSQLDVSSRKPAELLLFDLA